MQSETESECLHQSKKQNLGESQAINDTHFRRLIITGQDLTIDDLYNAVTQPTLVDIDLDCIDKITKVRAVLDKEASEKIVYGLNTGFGSLSKVVVPQNELVQMQYNIVRSHAFGVGEKCSHLISRMMILLRLNVFARGNSGVSLGVVLTLRDAFNKGLAPHIPKQGSVGASGDLAPLSHLALGVLGENVPVDLIDINNPLVILSTHDNCADVYSSVLKMNKCELHSKDGLCLVNGTQFIVSIATMAYRESLRLFYASMVVGSLSAWALRGCIGAFSENVQNVRPHPGQKLVADFMRNLLTEMPRHYTVNKVTGEKTFRTQDSYSIRCTPQILGPVYDNLVNMARILTTEINSSTDNPLVFLNEDGSVDIQSGGNFHGMYPANVSDQLTLALTIIANLSNARVKRLINKDLSGGLPSFLIDDSVAGSNSGLMILEYAHTALNSEIVTNAFPRSAQSIPTCESQEDHVSMGPIAAFNAFQNTQSLKRLLALELMAACQALDMLAEDIPRPTNKLATVYNMVRSKVPKWTIDHYPSNEINHCIQVIDNIYELFV